MATLAQISSLILLLCATGLYSQSPEYKEPILGEVVQELPPLSMLPQDTLDGSINFYEVIKLNIYEAQVYEAIELSLEAQSSEEVPVSLVVYSDVKEQSQLLRGNRLLTKGLIKQGKAKIHFQLPGQKTSYSPSEDLITGLLLEQENFPLYIVLYPFRPPPPEAPEQETSYYYSIRFIKKNYGLVRFRLLPSATAQSRSPYSALSIQIDDQSYAWEDDTSEELAKIRLSQPYRVSTGRHNVQVSNLNYYARNQFQVEPGKLETVNLQLKERLSQLLVIVPKGTAILLDGIPLQDKQRHTPVWQNVEIIELESFQHAIPRLKYNLTIPAGSHHILLQYEDKTWQQEIYLEQGTEQVFQLDWQLNSHSSP